MNSSQSYFCIFASPPFCQTLNHNNPVDRIANIALANVQRPQIIFWRKYFPIGILVNANVAHVEIGRQKSNGDFCRVFPIRDPNYIVVIMVITVHVSHRLLISAARINPVFMTAKRCRRSALYRCCCCCCYCRVYYCCCCCTRDRKSRIKSRKIENETTSCRVTVRLNAGM